MVLKGSRYAERLPIGKPEIIQKGSAERLKQFYADWYRPDLMAVVAVGDFDKAAMEKMITTHFASIPAAANFPILAGKVQECVASREKAEGVDEPSEPQVSIGRTIEKVLDQPAYSFR